MPENIESGSGKLAAYFLDNLTKIALRTFEKAKLADLVLMNAFITHFLETFTRDDFQPDRKQLLKFICLNEVIASLVVISGLRNTDSYVASLVARVEEPAIVLKLLTLYSAHNTMAIAPDFLFGLDADAASRWYYAYLGAVDSACLNEHTHENIRNLYRYTDARLCYSPTSMDHAYFAATYIDEASVAHTRRRIHETFSHINPPDPIGTNAPRTGGIAVVTGRWVPDNVVYRALAPYISHLGKHYELTLVNLGKESNPVDRSMFAHVINFDFDPDLPSVGALVSNNFSMVLFPDVGLSSESIYLASFRLAPVQVVLCGHPESTWSPAIDYFIHGADILDPLQAMHNFGERLVLIPGCGQLAVKPDYKLQGLLLPADEIRIACCWSTQKITHKHLLCLKKACEQATRAVKFVFFSGGSLAYLPVARAITDLLGSEHVEMVPELEYPDYMKLLESCHFAVDSYPFGGFITVVDLLWLRKPVVTLRGAHSYNRNAAWFLTLIGLDALIANTPELFVEQLARMINDEAFRNAAIRQMQEADLDATIFSTEAVPYFTRAVSMLLENHEQLRLQNPATPLIVSQ